MKWALQQTNIASNEKREENVKRDFEKQNK